MVEPPLEPSEVPTREEFTEVARRLLTELAETDDHVARRLRNETEPAE